MPLAGFAVEVGAGVGVTVGVVVGVLVGAGVGAGLTVGAGVGVGVVVVGGTYTCANPEPHSATDKNIAKQTLGTEILTIVNPS